VEPERDVSAQASAVAADGQPPVHVLKLATFCTSQAEFITQFKAFLDDRTLFLPSKVPLSVGQTVEFSICLQDEKPMLEGRGEVIHVRPNVGGRAERSGLRVRVHELTPPSRFIKDAIMAARSVAGAKASALAARFASPAPATPSLDAPAVTESSKSSPKPVPAPPGALISTPIARLAVSTRLSPKAGDGDTLVAIVEEPPNESAAAVKRSAAQGPVTPAGRLFAQGVQVSVPAGPAHQDPSDKSDGTPSSPFLEVSTRSIVSSINSRLTGQPDTSMGTAVTQVESNREMSSRLLWKPYMRSHTLPALLRGIATPTLLVWGREDAIVPLNVCQLYERAVPGATAQILDRCGHMPEMEKPTEFVQVVLDFLIAS